MGDKLKYKKGDIIFDVRSRPYGTIVKAEKSIDVENNTNKYDLELLDGSVIPITEYNIIETEYFKLKEEKAK